MGGIASVQNNSNDIDGRIIGIKSFFENCVILADERRYLVTQSACQSYGNKKDKWSNLSPLEILHTI